MEYNIDNVGDWLEDSITGRCSRYATEPELSVWICNECGEEFDNCSCSDIDHLELLEPRDL